MSETKHMAKFSPSPDLCSNCTRLLLSELRDAVLLHQSIFSLERSSQSCSLCRFIWTGLTGSLTVKNGPRFLCKLLDLDSTKPGQPSEIWGRRHMVDFASMGMDLAETNMYAWDIPISFIEVMMVKTDLAGSLARELRLRSAPESTRLKNAWWGLNCESDVIRETGCCPYVWEYLQEIRDVWRRDKWREHATLSGENWNFYRNPFSSTRPKDVWWGKGQYAESRYVVCVPTSQPVPFYSLMPRVLTSRAGVNGPYHRAVIEVSPLDHSPGWGAFRPGSQPGDQRDGGISGIVQRLKQEDTPNLCGSPARLELARHWLAGCLNLHLECNYWSESYSLPSRVIDVGPEDGSQEPFLYMPSSSHVGFYLCLSHRWGGAKVLQTVMGDPPGTPNGRKGTFSEFQSAIPVKSMPKTFQDAVQVTRALGFRYIWIDSLCIVQDRSSDWEAEAKKMGGYYRNACLTLVAGSAVSADSGLFFPITSPAVPCHVGSVSLEVPNCRHHGAEPHMFKLFAREPQMARSGFSVGSKPRCALDERSWVMQEEVLSARSLIFTDEGLYWECTNLSASEFQPHGSQYQYTRSLSSKDPEAYGGEVFLPSDQTYAQRFKCLLLEDPEFFFTSASTEFALFFRSMLPVARNELRSEVVALRETTNRGPPPDSTWNSEEIMQMVKHRQTQLRNRQQNFEVDEENGSVAAPTPQSSSPPPARARLSQGTNLTAQTRIWHLLVTDYSARHLTRESDRLIAIQGLVSLFSEVRKDQCYAGLWGRTLQEDILWKVSDSEVRLEHLCDCMPHKAYRFNEVRPRRRQDESEHRQEVAPSWSWASADQGVMFVKPTGTTRILEYFFRPLEIALDNDTAVLNVQGRLSLEGVLRPIGLLVWDNKDPRGEMYVSHLLSCDEG